MLSWYEKLPLDLMAIKKYDENICNSLSKTVEAFESWNNQVICGKDFTRFEKKIIKTKYKHKGEYYACRICGKAGDWIPGVHEVVAVLDNTMTDNYFLSNGTMLVNWKKLGRLFDFDRVAVLDMEDFEVQRFLIQVRNDMDPVRSGKYKKMECIIGWKCELEVNTIRNIKETFAAN